MWSKKILSILKSKFVGFIWPLLIALVVSLPFHYQPRFLISQPNFYLGSVFIGLYYLHYFFSDRLKKIVMFLKRIPHLDKFLMILIVSGLLFWIFAPNLKAKWGPIDDHEIMGILGTDGKLPISEVLPMWISGEAGHPGTSQRYRPLYSLFRLLESSVWGRNVFLWYLTRFLLAGSCLVLIWISSRKLIGLLGGGLLISYFLTYSLWGDIISRLGPSETYGLVGFGLLIWGLSSIIPAVFLGGDWTKKLSVWHLLAYSIGSILCLGSKENFIFLLAPLVVIYGLWIWQRKLVSRRLWIWGLILFTITLASHLFVTYAVLAFSNQSGTDVYQNSTGISARIESVITGFKHLYTKQMMLQLGTVCIFLGIFMVKKMKAFIAPTLLAGYGISSSIFIFVTQFMFYNRNWPDHSRYDFPGVFFISGSLVFFLCWLLFVLKKIQVKPKIIFSIKVGLLFGLLTMGVMSGYIDNMVKAKRNLANTENFSNRITKFSTQLKIHSAKYVVFESSNVWNYEFIWSYYWYLKAFGVQQSFGIVLNIDPEQLKPGLESDLYRQLTDWSVKGTQMYAPRSEWEPVASCLSIKLSGTKPTVCPEL